MMNQSATKIIAAVPILALLVQFAPMSLHAGADAPDGELRLDRYTLQPQNPTAEQLDLLATVVETQFPESIATVGAAIDYLLERSGYRRIPTESTAEGMTLPLPKVHQHIGPLKLRDTLQTIAGPALKLREDVASRVVWFTKLAGAEIPKDIDPAPADPAPVALSASLPQISTEWTLDTSLTLRGNFDIWTRIADWSLEWNSRHDYAVDQVAAYNGTLKDAVTAVLEHYRTAPIPLTATFFLGNAVLVVEPLDSTGR